MGLKCLARACQWYQYFICVWSGTRQLLRQPQWPVQPHTQGCLPGTAGSLHISVSMLSRPQAESASSKPENKTPTSSCLRHSLWFWKNENLQRQRIYFCFEWKPNIFETPTSSCREKENRQGKKLILLVFEREVYQAFASCYLAHKYCMAGTGSHCFCVSTGQKLPCSQKFPQYISPPSAGAPGFMQGAHFRNRVQVFQIIINSEEGNGIKVRVNAPDMSSLLFYPVWYIPCLISAWFTVSPPDPSV